MQHQTKFYDEQRVLELIALSEDQDDDDLAELLRWELSIIFPTFNIDL